MEEGETMRERGGRKGSIAGTLVCGCVCVCVCYGYLARERHLGKAIGVPLLSQAPVVALELPPAPVTSVTFSMTSGCP